MAEVSFNTLQLHACVVRWQAGERAAADDLLRAVGAQMESLTRKMLRGFPNVRSWSETGDVLQGSTLRLLNTLKKMQPESKRHFLNLAGVHIRRELIDLARTFATRREMMAAPGEESASGPAAGFAPTPDRSDDLELWCRFHEMVEQLPLEEREVISLRFYHGWTQVQIGEMFQIDERTVRTRWQSACIKLNRLLEGRLPKL